MTTPTGGTPATPPPSPYNAPTPADRRRSWLARIGGVAAIVALVIVLLTQCGGMDVSFDSNSSEETSTSESASPSETTPPPPEVNTDEEIEPVVAEGDLATCPTLWSPESLVTCIDKVAPWMWAKIDEHKVKSKIDSAMIKDWAARFPNKDMRVIFVYNGDADDAQLRAKAAAEAKLDPAIAQNLPIVRVEKAFPGWHVVNTRNLEEKRMDPFRDTRPNQVRVSLAPLNAKGEIDFAMAGSGFFVTCLNLHWLEQEKPVETPPPGTTTCCDKTTTTPSTVTTTTTPSTSTTTTTPSTSTTTTTTETTTTETTTTQTSPPKNPDGGPSTSIVMPPPPATDAETSPPPPSPTPLDPTLTSDAPTVAPPVLSTPAPPPVPTDLPSEEVTTTVVDPGSQG